MLSDNIITSKDTPSNNKIIDSIPRPTKTQQTPPSSMHEEIPDTDSVHISMSKLKIGNLSLFLK